MTEGEMFFWIFVVVIVYFIPTIATAGKKNSGGVFVVNVFLGWTLIGWVVALAWAVSLPRNDPKPETVGPSGELVTDAFGDTKRCPFCAEDIKRDAIVCKHCGRDLPRAEAPTGPAAAEKDVTPPPAAIP